MCELTQHPILDTVAYWILSLTLGLSHATDQGSILLILKVLLLEGWWCRYKRMGHGRSPMT